MRVIVPAVGALACMMAAGSARAQTCDSYLFPADPGAIVAARVVTRTPILDGVTCADPANGCGGRAYVLPGDIVARSPLARGGHACVAFFAHNRETTGWIATSALIAAALPAVTGDWRGRWTRVRGDAVLTISRSPRGTYHADAVATYAVARDNVRTGGADGMMTFRKGPNGVPIASFGSPGPDRTSVCRVELRRFGRWLLVNDGVTDDANSPCGGMGVTLTGIYRHERGLDPGYRVQQP